MKYDITVTDTYAGELNYSWVHRHEIEAPADIRTSTLVRRAKTAANLTGRERPVDPVTDTDLFHRNQHVGQAFGDAHHRITGIECRGVHDL